MISLLQLKSASLDYGNGFSSLQTVLLLLLILGVPMIPYLFLYLGLRDKGAAVSKAGKAPHFFELATKWLHLRHHPQLLHH